MGSHSGGIIIQLLKIEVAHPVDDIEQYKWGGEENPGVRVQLVDVDVDASLAPAPVLAVLVAAEEALAVLTVQALVETGVVIVLPVHGVVEGDDGRWTV